MKKLIPILLISLIAVFPSCNKDDINNTDTEVGISRVTTFPILSIKGERYMTVAKGGTFTDPGANAKVGSTDVPFTVSGTVTTTTPGVYTVVYSAVNDDGFTASARRTVVVYETDVTAAANDLSGNYARSTNGSVAVWTKIAPGVYTVFNPGGAPGTNLTVVAINPTGFTIDIPSQQSSDGSVTSSSGETYTPAPAPARYTMAILNPGYGTQARTFVKQ